MQMECSVQKPCKLFQFQKVLSWNKQRKETQLTQFIWKVADTMEVAWCGFHLHFSDSLLRYSTDKFKNDIRSLWLTGSLTWHYTGHIASIRRDCWAAWGITRHHHKNLLWLHHLWHLHVFILFIWTHAKLQLHPYAPTVMDDAATLISHFFKNKLAFLPQDNSKMLCCAATLWPAVLTC